MFSSRVVCKPSSNGARTDGSSMNVNNVISAKSSIRVLGQAQNSGSEMKDILSGGWTDTETVPKKGRKRVEINKEN